MKISSFTALGGFCLLLCLAVVPGRAQEQAATKEEIEEVKGTLEGLLESSTEYRNYVDALRKIKISGYLQPQYRNASTMDQAYPIGTFSGGLFPQYTKSMFQVRRGRLKVTYDNIVTQMVLQIDVTERGVGIKDAYLWLSDPWVKMLALKAGVFDRPFGYEVAFSSGSRESPERARVTQTLFPGERELGAQLSFAPQLGPLTFLKADLAVVNGSGPTSTEFDNFKDIIARVSAAFPIEDAGAEIDFGVSGYFGAVRRNTKALYGMGTTAAGVPGWVADADTVSLGTGIDRQYFGADVQIYYDLPVLGGTILRGEYVGGKQPGGSATSVSLSALQTGGLYQRTFSGWYVYLVQNIGQSFQVLGKYDVYDPNTEVEAGDFVQGSNLTSADLKYSTLGLGVLYHWDENVKFVLYNEFVQNETVPAGSPSSLAAYRDDVRDNVLTFRIQYRFP
jgi:hypothetical protein